MVTNVPEILTATGERFTSEESCLMAFLLYKRFGRDPSLAVKKWREMLQNSCNTVQFFEMARRGEHLWDTLSDV